MANRAELETLAAELETLAAAELETLAAAETTDAAQRTLSCP